MSKRVLWPEDVSTSILTKCHFRCCVCPEHRNVAHIHHMDGDPANSIESNGWDYVTNATEMLIQPRPCGGICEVSIFKSLRKTGKKFAANSRFS